MQVIYSAINAKFTYSESIIALGTQLHNADTIDHESAFSFCCVVLFLFSTKIIVILCN